MQTVMNFIYIARLSKIKVIVLSFKSECLAIIIAGDGRRVTKLWTNWNEINQSINQSIIYLTWLVRLAEASLQVRHEIKIKNGKIKTTFDRIRLPVLLDTNKKQTRSMTEYIDSGKKPEVTWKRGLVALARWKLYTFCKRVRRLKSVKPNFLHKLASIFKILKFKSIKWKKFGQTG